MGSVEKNGTIYEFDSFQLIPGEDLLLRHGEAVPVNHKAFRVLCLLIERNGHLVSKSEIMETVWQDAFVEEGSLTKSIWTIRNALGDTSKERFIQTIPKRGYRFVFPVSVITDRPGAYRRAGQPEDKDHEHPLKEVVIKTENNADGLVNIRGGGPDQFN
jgi:DNA-binding winged helix-turn-helix (wHTH) protein